MSLMMLKPAAKMWRLMPFQRDMADRLANELGIHSILAHLLLNRGCRDATSARRFLEAPLTDLEPPHRLPGATDAAARLCRGIQQRRSIMVYGDYDVDGVCATAILYRLFRLLDVPVAFYVPHRLESGYGLKSEPLREFAAAGVQTVVTVDCGINNVEEAAEAHRLGLELIITDHHEMTSALPAADAVVHPRLPGYDSEFPWLSGAGVAFKLAWAIAQQVSGGERVKAHFRDFLLDAVSLAALGLIADVMPLQAENRLLVKHGLARLSRNPLPGLQALLESAKISSSPPPKAEDVAFRLAPRLNAAGRLGCARLVVDLLTTQSSTRARELANYLDAQNRERQTLERRITQHAREMLACSEDADRPAIVLAHDEWHPGVIGIVAGRLAELYGKPALVVASGMSPATGSGRSVPGLDLHAALSDCATELISFGGHAGAVGFRIMPDRLPAFREKFCEIVASKRPSASSTILNLDLEVPLSALTPDLVRQMERLEPFGHDNPRPRFLAGNLHLVGEPKLVGGGERHLMFRVRQNETIYQAVAFGMADRLPELTSAQGQCSLAFTPRINNWRGMTTVDLEVVDFQPGPRASLG
jgi:single-stranded-DNA-specific exonuclease